MTTSRPELLERVRFWTDQGYRVISQTSDSAQLVRPRRFNPIEFIAMPIYLVEYLRQQDRTVYITVDAAGHVTESGSALDRTAYRRAQDRYSGPVRLAIVVGGFALFVAIVLVIQALT
jgi:hypothetical protein